MAILPHVLLVIEIALVLSCLVGLIKGGGWQWGLMLLGFFLMLVQNVCFNFLTSSIFGELTNPQLLANALSVLHPVALCLILFGTVGLNWKLTKRRDAQDIPAEAGQ